jgi:hypothetical protein
MMRQIVLACETLKDELDHAMRLENRPEEVRWIASGLHNYPDKLRSELQAAFDSFGEGGYERAIVTFGLCGNAAVGLRTSDFEAVIPKVDDCISLLFGSVAERIGKTKGIGTYFLTRGWLRGERTIWAEYEYTVNKYGKKTADSVMSAMMRNYKRLGVLDTGSYDVRSILPETERIADTLGLSHEIMPVSIGYLRQLLAGPWDEERFLVVPKHTEVKPFALS